jgi:hypothetical protein
MGTASLPFDSWGLAWRELWARLAPRCGRQDCARTLWRRLRVPRGIVRMQGARYCLDHCLERALADALRQMRATSRRSVLSHRLPLGLLLLSRQQVTADELRRALAEQRAAGQGRIGDWLQHLGFATDVQITAALARQWSCPVLDASLIAAGRDRIPQLPVALLESFAMVPVDYVAATATLHMAFGEGIDYSALYAIEQMLGCHTEACLVRPAALRQNLAVLAERRGGTEMVFDRVADAAEFARIIRSYAACVDAEEIRLAACGPHLWVRLLQASRPPLDLLLRPPA